MHANVGNSDVRPVVISRKLIKIDIKHYAEVGTTNSVAKLRSSPNAVWEIL